MAVLVYVAFYSTVLLSWHLLLPLLLLMRFTVVAVMVFDDVADVADAFPLLLLSCCCFILLVAADVVFYGDVAGAVVLFRKLLISCSCLFLLLLVPEIAAAIIHKTFQA